ncbi:hypothetical protein E2562_021428 [Oryza meyeriana var. granulata]|uniref:TAZ-type domain-containing protein n=1 Tax=Oryza meyeriana var. granulata TaxID=110450 RepID=A0A6G1EXT1_9ORYZ|nr:hypothetical protein E2562_021428 [Oryza meyeriana var. granulata]
MGALDHVFTDGSPCTGECCVGASRGDGSACTHRRGLLQLARHFAGCGSSAAGGCTHCRRFFQLLRLHSSVCDRSDDDSCSVPLCRYFKANVEEDKVDKTWKLLVKKVKRAMVMSAWANRQVPAPEIVQKSWAKILSGKKVLLYKDSNLGGHSAAEFLLQIFGRRKY